MGLCRKWHTCEGAAQSQAEVGMSVGQIRFDERFQVGNDSKTRGGEVEVVAWNRDCVVGLEGLAVIGLPPECDQESTARQSFETA